MRKIKLNFGKILIISFLVILFSQQFVSIALAKSNSQYNYETNSIDLEDGNSLLTALGKVIMTPIFPIFTSIKDITGSLMYIMTGKFSFPYADTIIFNRIPLLDVNFLNPENGSLFLKNNKQTIVGETVQNVYFTVLGICLGFLSVLVGIAAIKLAFSSIASEKAKYKDMINSTIKTIVLLFVMHYIIAFIFFLNEQLVEIASSITSKALKQDEIIKVVDGIQDIYDKDSEKLVNNFIDKANKTAWFSPITIAKKGFKEVVNTLGKAWDGFLKLIGMKKDKDGNYDDIDDYEELSENKSKKVREDYDEVFPSKADVIDKIKGLGDQGIYVASYLLKNYYYRDIYLFSIAGNDTNKWSKGGIGGVAQSAVNKVLWGTGIVDTGLEGLKNLYGSTAYIIIDMKNGDEIKSVDDYVRKSNQYLAQISSDKLEEKEKNTARINKLYLDAYFKYVYDKDDKNNVSIKNILTNLGEYFYTKSFYTDLEDDEWAPTSYSVIPATLFCMFVLQSIMFLFAYFKRMFYVIILAIMGPITVTFDYFKRMY